MSARNDAEVAQGIIRQIGALGRRLALDDPEPGTSLLRDVTAAVDQAFATAVAGWRENFSDAEIGRALDVSKQAVQQRWPR